MSQAVYFFVLFLVVTLDQLSKIYLLANVGLGNTTEFLPGFIQFYVVQNTGGAFSLLKEYPVYFKIIGLVNVVIFSYLTFDSNIKFNKLAKVGCLCVLGGTIGNLIDRFLRGGVIDFLDPQLFKFAVFNLADVFIDIGVVFILISLLITKEARKK